MTTTKINPNPLGYWDMPNGATPEYIAYDDLYLFLAFILMEHTGPGWADRVKESKFFEGFVQELQISTLSIIEHFLQWLDAEVDAGTLDESQRYQGGDAFNLGGMNHPNGNGWTTSFLLPEDEAEKDPARQVEYCQQPELRWEEDEQRWVLLFEYGVHHEDLRGVWWRINMQEDGWLDRYLNGVKRAMKKLAEAWGNPHHHEPFSRWSKLEVEDDG